MERPKIGLALGSGGAKGFAHIGVLKALEAAGIPIDYIAGSSIGALTAALYGVGHRHESMRKMALTFRRDVYLDFIIPKMGIISGKKLTELIKLMTHQKRFEDSTLPIRIVATDLIKGEKVIFQKGLLYEAVRASISIPGIFVPVKRGDQLLVDGGVIDRVPISVVRDMGADLVIGVDVAASVKAEEVHTIYDVIMQSIDIMQNEILRLTELRANVMIKPNVSTYHSKAFMNIEEIIKTGEISGMQAIPEIKKQMQQWKGEKK